MKLPVPTAVWWILYETSIFVEGTDNPHDGPFGVQQHFKGGRWVSVRIETDFYLESSVSIEGHFGANTVIIKQIKRFY